MKLNVSFPATGCQKLFEISDEHKLRMFYEKRMGAEVEADALGDEWKGYVVRISGGNDKQGFPMKQGRVRLLLSKGHSCYRPRRDGERKRKSVRGCIVDANLSVLCLVIVRKGKQRKRHRLALKKKRCLARKEQAAEYAKLLAQRQKEAKNRRQEEIKRRRSASMRDSKSSNQSAPSQK
ncbi:hypothetical protein DMN91_007748 [Ooceraea biroi]|uniref:Small ribosomal subunit protein eS6 n=1 Tax=Ooceraea biroi TaxID=2015173 RepID=A0A3L8DFW8_OOCBI|nr:hypothetical protein DMN91_007748 [Ooceraea biroi]